MVSPFSCLNWGNCYLKLLIISIYKSLTNIEHEVNRDICRQGLLLHLSVARAFFPVTYWREQLGEGLLGIFQVVTDNKVIIDMPLAKCIIQEVHKHIPDILTRVEARTAYTALWPVIGAIPQEGGKRKVGAWGGCGVEEGVQEVRGEL
jgi:hypothetical protein